MRIQLFALLLLVFAACSDEAERRYAPHQAFFRFSPVTAVQPLHAALGNPGLWCTVDYDAHHYLFSNASGNIVPYPRTALDAYGRPHSIAGFIVGTPRLPDVSGNFEPLAYDRACPSCYESAYIERPLHLAPDRPDEAHCLRCRRTYDLAIGSPTNAPNDGQHNARLYRYRLVSNIAGDVFIIQN
ncbi:hypothetical protein EII14_03570 [Alloprevotella sp. OH1205_COT-284]|uniref:hypothetical protein n=1 Tax=Alloprevotella sp. OH1205_COT-284 TaxID=2491043 RepID=UPI000F5FD719|nr:hypothetical protein [Alloprevotella sp. OH1205_COT-284]RRD80120.1 hypothetical protein EII14_03570 [Alloprevotella sp. OH1205_COT-284]